MNIFNLFAKLSLDKTDYEKGLQNAKEQSKDFSEKTKKQIGIISADAWTNLAGKVLNVAKSIAQASLETINYVDNIGDLAGKWGFSTREIQEFDYWATMSGTTLESLLTGMRGLVNQAEAGANAFNVLGINVKNQDGTLKGQKQLFLETLDALQKIPNQTERNALQFEIFGRAGIELGQIISRDAEELEGLSKEAENLGIILDEKTVNSAGKFNDELDKLKLQGRTAFAGLILGAEDSQTAFDNYITNLTTKLDELSPILFDAGTKIIGSFLKGLAKGLGNKLWKQVKFIAGEGWLWGDKTIDSSKEWLSQALFMNNKVLSDAETQLSNDTTSSNELLTDNSTTNINIEVTGTGYTSEDAKELADKLLKELSTRKQASGR